MNEFEGFPYAEVRFDRDGGAVGDGAPTADATALAADPAVTDLVVLVHGWNNDAEEAVRLYTGLAASMRALLGTGGVAPHGIGLLGVIWPSKKFDARVATGTAGGGAAAAGSPGARAEIVAQIDGLRDVFPDAAEQRILDGLVALVPDLESPGARRDFLQAARSLVAGTEVSPEDGPGDFFDRPGGTVMDRLAVPVRLAPPEGMSGGAAGLPARTGHGPADTGRGGAAGLTSLVGGVLGAARNALNLTTFYAMKDRAGVVGKDGLAPLLAGIAAARPALRIHLVGHSFGARLVCAAGLGMPTRSLATVTLLQAAFSHFGLSADWEPTKPGAQAGYFARLLSDKTVRGPILITHSRHDIPVGVAYALASRLRNQVAAGVGDANDVYGGLGRNGAQRTDTAVTATLLPTGARYTWTPGVPHNLLADEFVAGHSDVTGPQIASALLSAIAATRWQQAGDLVVPPCGPNVIEVGSAGVCPMNGNTTTSGGTADASA